MLTKMATLRIMLVAAFAVLVVQPSRVEALSLPALDPESLPNTNFSCIGKVIGGYYADIYTGCQMFHVCTLDEKGEIHDYKFGCIPGTVFDQETRVCERADEVDCSISESFFYLNNELYGPGIIPPTADTAATSSAATVQVLDPSVALLAATISPPASDTSTGHPTSPPPPPSVPSAADPPPPSQPVPTSSPPPPVIPPGVTASSASSTSRMSTSTSSSVTAAYAFPPLPFTVSRTSTSVSASSDVHIQTPLTQISISQGFDPSVLPAPHLRPSLLRLAAQAQNSGQTLKDLNPVSPNPVNSRTPADFEDVPRLAHRSSSTFNDGSAFSSRQKRQTTSVRGRSTPRNPLFPTTETSSAVTAATDDSTSLTSVASDTEAIASRGSSARVTSSRGRTRFRAPVSRQESTSARSVIIRSGSHIQNSQVATSPVRQRVQDTSLRQSNDRVQARQPIQNVSLHGRGRTVTSSRRRQEPKLQAIQPEIVVQSQQDSPVERVPRPQIPESLSLQTFVRPRTSPQATPSPPQFANQPVVAKIPASRKQVITVTETLSDSNDPSLRNDPLPLNDPTPLPPTVLTAELPPDSIHRVSDEATGGTDFSTTTTRPAFVFPVTSFSCHDKISGGLYADTETGCAVFHICSVGPDSSIIDNKFVCGEGTLFDQKSRTCQTASAVDCSLSESLYYLNDRLKGPENVVDLCQIQPLGTPLADLTSGCQNYIVCENVSDDHVAERQHACKKGYLFSQMRKQCLPHNKVKCVKETLSGILRMNSPKKGITYKRSRLTRSLLLHRLRRAALPPLANAVTNVGMEDARVRRALFSLAALQRWASENSCDTTFIEVYTLNTRDGDYPKKVFGETSHITRYGYILRKKRDVVNVTSAEQALVGNKTKSEETPSAPASVAASSNQEREEAEGSHQGLTINPTSTIPVIIPTITIPPKNGASTPALSKQAVLPRTNSITPSPSFNSSPTKIVGTLSTVTISNTGPHKSTVALPPALSSTEPHTTTVTLPPATVTVTNTVTVGLQNGETPVVNTAVPTLPVANEVQTVFSSTPSITVTAVNTVGNISITTDDTTHSTLNVTEGIVENSNSTPVSSPLGETEISPIPLNVSMTADNVTLSDTTPLPQNTTVEESAAVLPSNDAEASLDSASASSTVPATTPLQLDSAVTEASVENENSTVASNITTTTTAASTTSVTPPEGSINASTTVLPGDSDISSNSSTAAGTKAPAPTVGPFTRENVPDTNFTCKDKKLEQFYPDTEANCQVFHYCSPGFEDTQILDLKFLCTGFTMFDVNTQKCENMTNVTCGEESTTPDTSIQESIDNSTAANVTIPIDDSLNTTSLVSEAPHGVDNQTSLSNTSTMAVPVQENATLTILDDLQPDNSTLVSNKTADVQNMTLTTQLPEINATSDQHNWNATTKSEVLDAGNQTSSEAHVADTALTLNQTLSPLESTTESEALFEELNEQPDENDDGVFTSTVENLLDEAVTELYIEDTEVVTERFAREEIPTSTVGTHEAYTTEFMLEDELIITTDLGPFAQPNGNVFEAVTESERTDEMVTVGVEPSTDVPIQTSTVSVPHLSSAIPSQISSTSNPLPALNDTNISSTVMNNSSIKASESTHIETP